jgi:hypothetical protein
MDKFLVLPKYFFVAMIFSICTFAYADPSTEFSDPQIYHYYPSCPIYLGAGFSPNDLARAKAPCITFTPMVTDGIDPNTAVATSFFEQLVTSSDQLKEVLSIDAKIDASYMSFGGSASFNYSSEGLFSDNSLTFVITARTEYGRLRADSPKLKPEYENLLNDPAKFESVCGSRFVVLERRGASASAIVTVFGISKELHDSITASLSVHGGTGPFSADAAASFNKEVKRATKCSELNIQVVATGGTGLSNLSGVINARAASSDNAAAGIETALSEFVRGISAQNASPIEYSVISMEFTGWKPQITNIWTDRKEKILRKIVDDYRKISAEIDEANSVLNGTDLRASKINHDKDSSIRSLISSDEDRITKLVQAYSDCKGDTTSAGNNCVEPLFTPLENPIPKIPAAPVMSYEVRESNSTNGEIKMGDIQTRASLRDSSLFEISRSNFIEFQRSMQPLDKDRYSDILERMRPLGIMSSASLKIKVIDQDQIFQSLSVKMGGTSNYIDFKNLGNSSGDQTFSLSDLTYKMKMYIYNDLIQFSKNSSSSQSHDVSAVFAIHITDSMGKNYYLPIADGTWKIEMGPATTGSPMFAPAPAGAFNIGNVKAIDVSLKPEV